MPRRRRPKKRKTGIGLGYYGCVVGILSFALVFFFTASIPVAVVGGFLGGIAMVIYIPIRRIRRRGREAAAE